MKDRRYTEITPRAPELSTHFCISGWDFDEVQCTKAIGIEPSNIWKQKHEQLKNRQDIPNTSWEIGSTKQKLYSVNDAIEEVLKIIWPVRDRIIKFINQNDLRLSMICNVTIYDERPIYDLSVEAISKLAELECEFSLDVFDYSSEED